jgi:hypothetical protein
MANAETIWVVTDNRRINNNGIRGVSPQSDPYSGEWEENLNVGAIAPLVHSNNTSVLDAVPISAEKLEQEMTSFLEVVGKVFEKAEDRAIANSALKLDEIQLSVEISGEGEVKLLGTGAKAAGRGGMTLTFRRR